MFTGLIDHCGCVVAQQNQKNGQRLTISTHYDDLSVGESVSVNGICLTVVDYFQTTRQFTCDLSPETLQLTHASDWRSGTLVNLERSLRLNDRLNGHFVLGHVDQVARIQAIKNHDAYAAYVMDGFLTESRPFLIKKGSVAINGVSLTINQVNEDAIEVMLIPETLRRTNLASLQTGDRVNVEYDYLAKLMVHSLKSTIS